jgi:hypothetical protein
MTIANSLILPFSPANDNLIFHETIFITITYIWYVFFVSFSYVPRANFVICLWTINLSRN